MLGLVLVDFPTDVVTHYHGAVECGLISVPVSGLLLELGFLVACLRSWGSIRCPPPNTLCGWVCCGPGPIPRSPVVYLIGTGPLRTEMVIMDHSRHVCVLLCPPSPFLAPMPRTAAAENMWVSWWEVSAATDAGTGPAPPGWDIHRWWAPFGCHAGL